MVCRSQGFPQTGKKSDNLPAEVRASLVFPSRLAGSVRSGAEAVGLRLHQCPDSGRAVARPLSLHHKAVNSDHWRRALVESTVQTASEQSVDLAVAVEDIAAKRLKLPSLTNISKHVMSHPISHSCHRRAD